MILDKILLFLILASAASIFRTETSTTKTSKPNSGKIKSTTSKTTSSKITTTTTTTTKATSSTSLRKLIQNFNFLNFFMFVFLKIKLFVVVQLVQKVLIVNFYLYRHAFHDYVLLYIFLKHIYM